MRDRIDRIDRIDRVLAVRARKDAVLAGRRLRRPISACSTTKLIHLEYQAGSPGSHSDRCLQE